MGTQNLTCVVQGGKYKVAQYGQWDGYPSGQGMTALKFLRAGDNVPKLQEALKRCRWITKEELTEHERDSLSDFPFKMIDRDHGATILELITQAEGEIVLQDNSNFAADSLFCEWAYVIDLDKETFEVYGGFNTAPIPAGERFSDVTMEDDSYRKTKYWPVRHLKTFGLNSLPTDEEFLAVEKIAYPDEE